MLPQPSGIQTCSTATTGAVLPAFNWRKCCAGIIPCLDEEAEIRAVVDGVKAYVDRVIVIDDGSRDRTEERARAGGATVLANPGPHGKGAALRLGWNWALDHGFEWALCLDGDGQHSPADIPRFFSCVERTSAVLVIGNRMHEAAGMPFSRRWVNRWMSRKLSRLAGMDLPDSQCGFRLCKLAMWRSLPISTDHFEVESEVLLAFARAGAAIEFVPIPALYKGQQSKIHPVKDALRWFRWWHRACRRAIS